MYRAMYELDAGFMDLISHLTVSTKNKRKKKSTMVCSNGAGLLRHVRQADKAFSRKTAFSIFFLYSVGY